MLVYKLDADGNFLHEHECQPCPITKGWLFPTYYTEVAPPEGEFSVVKFKAGVWVLEGFKKIYKKDNKSELEIPESSAVPEDYTSEIPKFLKYEIWDEKTSTWINSIDLAKEIRSAYIDASFDMEFINGHFLSAELGIEVDYRRFSSKNDLQNVLALINVMVRNGISTTIYKGYETQKATATVAQLKVLTEEMEDYGVYLHNKKDSLKTLISESTSIEEVNNIDW